MYRGQLSAMADVIEQELQYYRDLAKEQKEIIEQLTGTGQPKGYVYMHPYDVSDMLNSLTAQYVTIDIYRKQPEDRNLIQIHGRNIKQSAHIPAVSKNFK